MGWEPWLSQCTRVNSKADSSAPRLNAGAGGLGSCDNQGPSVFQVFRCPAGRSPVLVFHVLSPFCAKPGPSTSTLGSTLLALAPPPLRNHPPNPILALALARSPSTGWAGGRGVQKETRRYTCRGSLGPQALAWQRESTGVSWTLQSLQKREWDPRIRPGVGEGCRAKVGLLTGVGGASKASGQPPCEREEPALLPAG